MIYNILNHAGQVIDQLLDLLAQIDLFSAAIALFIFWRIGEEAVNQKHTLRRTGLGIGLLGFCTFLVRIWITVGLHTGPDLASAAVRSLLCAGFITSLSWMLLAILGFLYHHTSAAVGAVLRQR